jgi:pyruvate dehydrogenase (quinone)
MAKLKVADIIIEVLQLAGAKRCYGAVGDTLNQITDAIRRRGMEWVHVRHEEAGAFAAGADSAGMGLFAEKWSSVHKALRVSRRNRP